MKVRYTRRAESDLATILAYLDDRSPSGANTVKRAIKTAVELIGRYPDLGRVSDEMEARSLPVGRYPYLIYWLVIDGEVRIVHIRHASRSRP